MEMFDEISTTIYPDGRVEVKHMDDAFQAEAMSEACGLFLTSERKFKKLNANQRCVTDPDLNVQWWDALDMVYRAERNVRRLFVGSHPNPRSNMLYAKFREMLLRGSKLKADA